MKSLKLLHQVIFGKTKEADYLDIKTILRFKEKTLIELIKMKSFLVINSH